MKKVNCKNCVHLDVCHFHECCNDIERSVNDPRLKSQA